ncbi:MAG: TraB/GumN family protein [Treponema sp.]|nr:TraB/GumN family protein [Treponema sp.]
MDTATQKHLLLNGKSIILIGTAHVSEQSVTEVSETIEKELPDTVAIELDEKRYESLKDPDSWRKMDIIKVLRNKNGFLMLANIVLSSYQKKMGLETGVKPGDEMLSAIKKAEELNIPCSMVDRSISVTLRRAWAKNSLIGKCNLLAALFGAAFSKEEISAEQIENLKVRSEMDGMMDELSKSMPGVKEVLIDERDRFLASHIWECNGQKILAVLGAGHLNGVIHHLEKLAASQESSDCSDIDSVPEKSAASKAASWIIPIFIVALIVAGFIFGGASKGWNMLSSWVLWNGILAAIGALIAGGHPLTVLVSFAGAPITSLCPFVGIGMLSGIVQAIVCKPKVEDLASMQEDASSLKGFYKNRIIRTLMVFVLSSLGSSVGTFIAGAKFVTIIASFWNKIVSAVKG